MPGRQRIHVVSTAADEAELTRLRRDLGRDPVVLTAPTAEARRVVRTLDADPRVEVLLAPVRFPPVDRGHGLDALVRSHAVRDRFRDVVVVTDAATATLLLRVLAPDQLSDRGAVTVVGLPRPDRPTDVRRAVAAGLVLAVLAGLAQPVAPILVLPAMAALLGVGPTLVPRWRHLGLELLLAATVAVAAVVLVVAGSARFPGGW